METCPSIEQKQLNSLQVTGPVAFIQLLDDQDDSESPSTKWKQMCSRASVLVVPYNKLVLILRVSNFLLPLGLLHLLITLTELLQFPPSEEPQGQ